MNHRTRRSYFGVSAAVLAFVVALCLPSSAWGEEAGDAPNEEPRAQAASEGLLGRLVKCGGYVEISFVMNANDPDDRLNGNALRVFDRDHNTFALDMFELYLEKPAESGKAGFRVDLDYGTMSSIEASTGLGVTADELDVQQAYITYITSAFGSSLKLDLGKFCTHMGAEVIESHDNYSFSRSFLFGYAIPFTHTGFKASFPLSGKFDAMVMVANGWDNARDNNDSKTIGLQICWKFIEDGMLALNLVHGPEQDDNSTDNRSVVDVVCSAVISSRASVIFNADFGTEQIPGVDGGKAGWSGANVAVRYSVNDWYRIAGRAEYFSDDDGARTGTPQDLFGLTWTNDFIFAENLLVRAEVRHDRSNKESFLDESGVSSNQTTLAMAVTYTF